MLKILLVDDHELFRVGVKTLLSSLGEDVQISEAPDCAVAIALAAKQRFDVVLLDLRLPGLSGMEALPLMRAHSEDAAIVVLSGEDAPALVREVIEHGAAGFIPKSSSPAVMMAALRLVLAGGTYLPSQVLSSGPLAAYPPSGHYKGLNVANTTGPHLTSALSKMTDRQIESLRLAMQGKPNKIIARDMNISEATVKAHLATAFRVLEVKNRTEAVFVAARAGLPGMT